MISLQSVEVFVKYDGNADALARVATPEEQALLADGVIHKIEDIVLHLSLAKMSAASASYSAETSSQTSPGNIEPSGFLLLSQFLASR